MSKKNKTKQMKAQLGIKNNRGETFVGVRNTVMQSKKDKQNSRQNRKRDLPSYNTRITSKDADYQY